MTSPHLCLGWRILLVLGCLRALSACAPSAESAPEAAARAASHPFSTPSMTAWSSPGQIKAQCLVQSQRSVKLKAELGGRIDEVTASQGQHVQAGQLLARIGTQEQALELERLRLSVQQSQARSELLQAQIRQAEASWQAMQPLYKSLPTDMLPKEALTLQERRAELRLEDLSRQDLQLQIRNLERILRQAEIRSPLGGVILSRNAEVGMVVSPGVSGLTGSDVLFEVGDPDKLRVECAAREGDAASLRAGIPMSLTLDGLRAHPINLQVSRVAPAIVNDAGSSSLPFWGDFDRPANLPVLAGMHGNASLQLTPPPIATPAP